MSRGPGRLQRWLIANLPARDSGSPTTAADLASAYYATDKPTPLQRATVLHSLQGLNQRGLAKRWPRPPHQRGKPIPWTR